MIRWICVYNCYSSYSIDPFISLSTSIKCPLSPITIFLLKSILTHTSITTWLSLSFLKNIYLFIWLHRVLVVADGLLSCRSLAPYLQHAFGIQFPDQGSNPGPLHWEH